MAEKKRCMTELDAETLAAVTRLREAEDRSESQMIAILVKRGLAAKQSKLRSPMPSTN